MRVLDVESIGRLALDGAPETERAIDALDEADPLKRFRGEFELPEGLIYLDGNSLGALPKRAADRVRRVAVQEWGQGLIRAWVSAGWIDLPRSIGCKLAPLLGAGSDEVIVADSTSVNLFKCMYAAADINKGRTTILTERGDFPSDVYMAEGVERLTQGRLRHRAVEREHVATCIDGDTAVVVLSHVHYRSALVHDMRHLTARAHDAGALIVWDLSHAAGAIRIELGAAGADFAVGCGYKYLNGGPGAPAFVFAARRHHGTMRSPLPGWFGHAAPFSFADSYWPANGIARFACGTPAILSMSALDASLDVLLGADIGEIERKGRSLGQLFIALVERHCADLVLASPRDALQRGCHVAFRHADGYAIMRALIERGVIGDFRDADVLRFGFAPLYVRYRDILEAVRVLHDVLTSGSWREPRYRERAAVT